MENERFELQNVAILLSWQLPSFANYKENGQNSRFKKTQNGNIIPRTSPDPLINIANVNQRDKDPGPPIRPYGPQLPGVAATAHQTAPSCEGSANSSGIRGPCCSSGIPLYYILFYTMRLQILVYVAVIICFSSLETLPAANGKIDQKMMKTA